MGSQGFEVARAREVHRSGFIGVDEVTVRAAGTEFERSVVRHPGAVAVVPVEADGATVVCVRQWRVAVTSAVLEIPAGKRDVTGEPPEVTAQRELEEEIGFRAGRLVPLVAFLNSPGFTDELTHVFAAFDLHDVGSARPVGPEEQAMTLERVALADVERLIVAGELTDAKSIIGVLLTRELLAGGTGGGAR